MESWYVYDTTKGNKINLIEMTREIERKETKREVLEKLYGFRFVMYDEGYEVAAWTCDEDDVKRFAKATDNEIIVYMQRATRDVTINEVKLCRWVSMCKFLEENATIDDKTVIGQWLKATNLQEQNEKLRAENEKLKAKIEALRDAVEGWLYE